MSDAVMDSRRIKGLILSASPYEIEEVWLKKIVELQTDKEISDGLSITDNKIGLNMKDAPILTSYYKRVKSGKHLTPVQINVCRNKLPKYWRQYVRMMNNGIKKKV